MYLHEPPAVIESGRPPVKGEKHMGTDLSRRSFLRATDGVAGAVALGMAGTAVAEEEDKRP